MINEVIYLPSFVAGGLPPRFFVGHSIYKGKAALTVEPRAPEFVALDVCFISACFVDCKNTVPSGYQIASSLSLMVLCVNDDYYGCSQGHSNYPRKVLFCYSLPLQQEFDSMTGAGSR